MKNIAIHIFRRDYRLYDNTTLIEVCKTHDLIIPIFIFTHKQIDHAQNPFRSDNCLQFLCESLHDLDTQLQHTESTNKLYIFYGDELTILADLIHLIPDLKTISFNQDYTKYSTERDAKIKNLCTQNDIQCLSLEDICLNPVGTVLTTNGKVYTKFTPFWRASAVKPIRKPMPNTAKNYLHSKHQLSKKLDIYKHHITINEVMKPNGLILGNLNSKIPEHGGRTNALAILKHISTWNDYTEQRDQLIYKTTHLSAHNKFGCISIREVYWCMVDKLGKKNGVIQQLFWRDFFYHLSAKYSADIYVHSLNPKYRAIKWVHDKSAFEKWCDGKTGFPIVDACMRELNATGYMHNRGRLITSNFLCRLMHMDWHLGERYFATRLYDYDPAQNNFGWQVSGANSSGTTSRPLEQTIMNPWLQSSQFDKNGEYIKKWCPELANIVANDLHKWNIKCDEWFAKGVKYIEPMLDYKTEKEINLKMYRKYI